MRPPNSKSLPARGLRFALIGFGGIAQEVLRLADGHSVPQIACVAVLARAEKLTAIAERLPAGTRAVSTVEELLATGPNVVADCAGHEAFRCYAEPVLRGGVRLISVSSGALAARELEARLAAIQAIPGSGSLHLASGAIVGIDGLAAARCGGLDRVTYKGIKPAGAWRGTPAERLLDLDSLTGPTELFRGTAREAAMQYPANANVTATIALAGIGFDRTEVRLIADPTGRENIHALEYAGAFGEARIEVRGRPSAANPKTSMLTGLSVWRALCQESLGDLPVKAVSQSAE